MCCTAHATMKQSCSPTSEGSLVCGAIQQADDSHERFFDEKEFVGALASWWPAVSRLSALCDGNTDSRHSGTLKSRPRNPGGAWRACEQQPRLVGMERIRNANPLIYWRPRQDSNLRPTV
jgi:hypothetical protein